MSDEPIQTASGGWDFPGTHKACAGVWVVNTDTAERIGLLTRFGGRWRPECDYGCEIPDASRGWAEAERALRAHWERAHQ